MLRLSLFTNPLTSHSEAGVVATTRRIYTATKQAKAWCRSFAFTQDDFVGVHGLIPTHTYVIARSIKRILKLVFGRRGNLLELACPQYKTLEGVAFTMRLLRRYGLVLFSDSILLAMTINGKD